MTLKHIATASIGPLTSTLSAAALRIAVKGGIAVCVQIAVEIWCRTKLQISRRQHQKLFINIPAKHFSYRSSSNLAPGMVGLTER